VCALVCVCVTSNVAVRGSLIFFPRQYSIANFEKYFETAILDLF